MKGRITADIPPSLQIYPQFPILIEAGASKMWAPKQELGNQRQY